MKTKFIIKSFILILLVIVFSSCNKTENLNYSKNQNKTVNSGKIKFVSLSELEKIKGLYYRKSSKKLFTGKSITKYKNGKKLTETDWKDGQIDGYYVVWHKNGYKKSESNYKSGKRIFIQFYKDGKKVNKHYDKDGWIF